MLFHHVPTKQLLSIIYGFYKPLKISLGIWQKMLLTGSASTWWNSEECVSWFDLSYDGSMGLKSWMFDVQEQWSHLCIHQIIHLQLFKCAKEYCLTKRCYDYHRRLWPWRCVPFIDNEIDWYMIKCLPHKWYNPVFSSKTFTKILQFLQWIVFFPQCCCILLYIHSYPPYLRKVKMYWTRWLRFVAQLQCLLAHCKCFLWWTSDSMRILHRPVHKI